MKPGLTNHQRKMFALTASIVAGVPDENYDAGGGLVRFEERRGIYKGGGIGWLIESGAKNTAHREGESTVDYYCRVFKDDITLENQTRWYHFAFGCIWQGIDVTPLCAAMRLLYLSHFTGTHDEFSEKIRLFEDVSTKAEYSKYMKNALAAKATSQAPEIIEKLKRDFAKEHGVQI